MPNLQKEFASRLHECMGDSPVAAFARQCGISESLLRKYLAGSALPGTDKLIHLAYGAHTSLDWLVSGRGSRERLGGEEPAVVCDRLGQTMVYPPHLNPPERAIDALPRGVTFGFDIAWARRVLGCEPDDLALFTMTGNAMEPSVCEGDMLLLDTASNHHSEDSLYLLSRQGHLLVKRVQSNLDGGALLVRSDNPAYKDELIAVKDMAELDVAIVGRVVWISGVV